MRNVRFLAAVVALLVIACATPEHYPGELELCPFERGRHGTPRPRVEWSDAAVELGRISLAYDAALPSRLGERSWEWRLGCELPARERFGVPAVLHHVSSARPVPPALVDDVARVVEGLPPPLTKLFERHVCAVVPMHGAPMTGTLWPLTFDHRRSIVLLDVDKVSLPPNDWLAFKESTVFAALPEQAFVGKMAEPGENVRAVLLEFLLIHELGHVLDAAFPEHRLIDDFKSISWPRKDALAEAPLVHYPERNDAEPLPSERLEAYYDLIAAGAFPSPAAAANEKEDFAESLATFMHTAVRGRPWQLEVRREGKLVRRLRSCWEERRCLAKRRILEGLIRRWAEE